mgnify:FL=1|jgi:hypothetical protein|tara:strand:- start:4356 stop:4586 length:231 start_codon:yes stop_codon:yes gene_type:complete
MTTTEEFELRVYGREGSVSRTCLSTKDDAIRAAKDAAALEMTLNAEVFAHPRDIDPIFEATGKYGPRYHWCDVEEA